MEQPAPQALDLVDRVGHVDQVTLGAVQLDFGLVQPDQVGRGAGLDGRGQARHQLGAGGRDEGGLVILEAGHFAELVELGLDGVVGLGVKVGRCQ